MKHRDSSCGLITPFRSRVLREETTEDRAVPGDQVQSVSNVGRFESFTQTLGGGDIAICGLSLTPLTFTIQKLVITESVRIGSLRRWMSWEKGNSF